MRSNGIPMTMQVGICCQNESIVLVSDTKVTVTDRQYGPNEPIETAIHRLKVSFGSEHGIAVAMAGESATGSDIASELATYLSGQDAPGDNFCFVLKNWGDRYYHEQHPDDKKNRESGPRLLVVAPTCGIARLWQLKINHVSEFTPSKRSMINGNENNSAVFWLAYSRALDRLLTMRAATGAAITTILTAGSINNYGVGGLEVHQYHDGSWHSWSSKETEACEVNFQSKVERRLEKILTDLGIRPVTPPGV